MSFNKTGTPVGMKVIGTSTCPHCNEKYASTQCPNCGDSKSSNFNQDVEAIYGSKKQEKTNNAV